MPATLKDCFHSRGARPALRQGVCASLLLASTAGSTSEILEYRCSPDIKHECTASGCETISSDSGFQQAESFVYNPETGAAVRLFMDQLLCWQRNSICRAQTWTAFTVVGRLLPVRPGNEPVIVTLTIKTPLETEPQGDEEAGFTAAWGYGGEGLALDMGKCVLSR